ncbi:MAG: CRISPR-associated endonuclease Cas3'' [Candidatus Bathyarchaeota archaeon]|nr:CRISPR-associated endonuclease Cas3'' [Candidatus Bathyarchaeota archaeon]
MSKKQMIKDLSLNSHIDDVFILKDVEFRVRRDKRTVDMFFKIGDRTGDIMAILWDVSEERIEKYKKIRFARIRGHVSKKKADGSLQATISSIIEAAPIDYSDYMPQSKRDLDKLMNEIYSKIKSINNNHLKDLLKSFFEDPGFVKKFKKAPAATKVHQPYLGGLLEHTCNLIRICETISNIYQEIDRDFLITMALLHDIGKVREYNYEKVIEYTDEGKLLGHIAIGLEMIDRKINDLKNFPRDLALMIKHTVLSHHGHFEYGSPKLPSILTAIALHYADETEAKVSGFVNIKEENKNFEEKWSKWIWWLERPVYLDEEATLEGESRED